MPRRSQPRESEFPILNLPASVDRHGWGTALAVVMPLEPAASRTSDTMGVVGSEPRSRGLTCNEQAAAIAAGHCSSSEDARSAASGCPERWPRIAPSAVSLQIADMR